MKKRIFIGALASAVAFFGIMASASAQSPAYNPFPTLGDMMVLMQPISNQSAVQHCPKHFAIADPKAHAAGLAKAKQTFTNPGPYHYNTLKTRADNSYKKNPNLCDQELAELKAKGSRDLILKK